MVKNIIGKKAEIEAKEQVKNYASVDFIDNGFRFWFPKEFDDWWFDKGGAELTMKGRGKALKEQTLIFNNLRKKYGI